MTRWKTRPHPTILSQPPWLMVEQHEIEVLPFAAAISLTLQRLDAEGDSPCKS